MRLQDFQQIMDVRVRHVRLHCCKGGIYGCELACVV